MNPKQLFILLTTILSSCSVNYSVVNKSFTGITGYETSIDWGNTTYSFGTNTYEVRIFESHSPSRITVVEQGNYSLLRKKISFEPIMKRINPDTNKIGGVRAGGWNYIPKFYSDSVNVDIRRLHFQPYIYTMYHRQKMFNIFNPETRRHFTESPFPK
jgi:hypothetical protein